MFGDVNARAKDAMSKGTKAIEELVEFSKGNVEARGRFGPRRRQGCRGNREVFG